MLSVLYQRILLPLNNWCYEVAIQRFKKTHKMRSLSRWGVNRVIASEGEILSFAQPLESIQRKGGSIAAQSALLGFIGGGIEGFLPSYRRAVSMPSPYCGQSQQNLRCSARQTRVKPRYCVTSVATFYTVGTGLDLSLHYDRFYVHF